MTSLTVDQFADFFRELHHRPPYFWQTCLAARAIDGDWPEVIDLPTGSGKTACIDVAVFALACQAGRPVAERTAPRRIFFCVNRRVIVDEAYERAKRIAERLGKAARNPASDSPVLFKVAAALRQVAGTKKGDDAPPLDVLELRGGIYRDNRWARAAAQPTVVCTTLDQLGSRLLFRGYGVSPGAAPIQAALIAYDSLVLLDEAHISEPFRQSLERVQGYLDPAKWAEQSIGVRPMLFVPMTATPPPGIDPSNVIRLDEKKDRENESLDRRLRASKRASLHRVTDVSAAIIEHAGDQKKNGCAAIGIIVNRVATAKEIYRRLQEKHPDAVELVIGAMRPFDRDTQAERLAKLVGSERPKVSEKTSFVVATQCLEVGADYDFDVLITECASLDSLRQRFGRLDRGGRDILARAVIVVKDKDVKSEDDPIYGSALAHTWNWLWEHADVESGLEAGETTGKRSRSKAKSADEPRTIDFGIDAFDGLLREHSTDGRIPSDLLVASADAPVMLPAYVDFWCQTSPKPVPDPDVALFIHGPQHGEPDIQVCWRADLIEKDGMTIDDWCDVVALLPPTTAECMSVPISRVRRWLAQAEDPASDLGDVLEVARQPEDESGDRDRRQKERSLRTHGVLWRGADRSKLLESPNDLRPGDTLVLPVSGKGWNELGHIPETKTWKEAPAEPSQPDVPAPPEAAYDVAEAAFQKARDRYVLRLHPSLRALLPRSAGINALLERLADTEDPPKAGELRDLMSEAASELPEDDKILRDSLNDFTKNGFLRERYPDKRGIVITARKRIFDPESCFLHSLDDGEDDASRIGRIESVSLKAHTRHVCAALDQTLNLIPSSVRKEAYWVAAKRHDWGKADERFQAMLSCTDRTDAWLTAGPSRVLLAKSDRQAQTPSERRAARERAGLPWGFRHEMLSVQLAERAGPSARDTVERDLILHLIAAHHGYARPLAPFVHDDEPPEVELEEVTISPSERLERPPYRLDSGIADRFWSLTRRYGWWGLAYLEALLRLADHQASANEDAGHYDNDDTSETAEATP